MDDLGVFVGIRPQGKSAPMAASKAAASNRTGNHMDPPFSTSKSKPNSSSDQFDPFGFGFDRKPTNGSDIRGWDFDIEAVLKGSMNLNKKSNSDDDVNDLIWGVSEKVRSQGGAVDGVDLLSSDPVAVDNWGNLSGIGSGSRVDDTDVFISGFEMGSSTRAQASSTQKISGSSSIEELENFGLGRIKKKPNGCSDVLKISMPKTTFKTKSTEPNLIDIDIGIGGFGGGSMHHEKVESVSQNIFEAGPPDLDSIFGAYSQKHQPAPEKTTRNVKVEEVFDPIPSIPVSIKKNASRVNSYDDMFFGVASMSTQFEEVDGESKERRSARLAHYQSTQARMAGALADLNEREFRVQQEQEERHRIAEAMDMEIKRWAAGKEGNLRALLSSLQLVLAPELGWKGVCLTDLITSSQVKIAYKKAALCVHPDKVQQKGANLQQKYVAEKVFDFLKEAWNKFNSEELR